MGEIHRYSLCFLPLKFVHNHTKSQAIPDQAFGISNDEDIRCEVNGALWKLAGSVNTEYKIAKGTYKRKKLDAKSKRFHILQGQTASVAGLRRESNLMRDQVAEWGSEYENLKEEKVK